MGVGSSRVPVTCIAHNDIGFGGFVLQLWVSKFAFVLCILFVAPILETDGQGGVSGWTFLSFKQKVTALDSVAVLSSPAEDSILVKMADDLGRIQSSYLRKFHEGSDTETAIMGNAGSLYAASMLDDLHALNSLPENSASRLAILRQVEGDLAAKADVGGALAVGPDSFTKTVDIVVRVQAAAGQSIPPNLSVLANSSLHGTQQPATYIFTPSSGNYRMQVSPGLICVWVAVSGNVLVQHLYAAGHNGNTEDFPISLSGGLGTCAL
jgi:hypothetical protein